MIIIKAIIIKPPETLKKPTVKTPGCIRWKLKKLKRYRERQKPSFLFRAFQPVPKSVRKKVSIVGGVMGSLSWFRILAPGCGGAVPPFFVCERRAATFYFGMVR